MCEWDHIQIVETHQAEFWGFCPSIISTGNSEQNPKLSFICFEIYNVNKFFFVSLQVRDSLSISQWLIFSSVSVTPQTTPPWWPWRTTSLTCPVPSWPSLSWNLSQLKFWWSCSSPPTRFSWWWRRKRFSWENTTGDSWCAALEGRQSLQLSGPLLGPWDLEASGKKLFEGRKKNSNKHTHTHTRKTRQCSASVYIGCAPKPSHTPKLSHWWTELAKRSFAVFPIWFYIFWMYQWTE